MLIQGFVLENAEKVRRAIEGSHSGYDTKFPPLGESYTEEQLLVAYDRLGGLITKDGVKVKMGSFFDFEKKVARKEPKVVFLTTIDGVEVEVEEEEAKAIKKAQSKLADLKVKKIKKAKKDNDE
jgi:hypothetical protein